MCSHDISEIIPNTKEIILLTRIAIFLNKLLEHLRKIKLDTKSFENRLLENLEKKNCIFANCLETKIFTKRMKKRV